LRLRARKGGGARSYKGPRRGRGKSEVEPRGCLLRYARHVKWAGASVNGG
jgi:hypothetical protein